jgi:hypothetical protein
MAAGSTNRRTETPARQHCAIGSCAQDPEHGDPTYFLYSVPDNGIRDPVMMIIIIIVNTETAYIVNMIHHDGTHNQCGIAYDGNHGLDICPALRADIINRMDFRPRCSNLNHSDNGSFDS